MLGYVTVPGIGTADRLLAEVAEELAEQGVPLAGVIQVNTENPRGGPWIMTLHALAGRDRMRISQDLGAGAQGCRLDPDGLEQAVALSQRALQEDGEDRPRLLIVNKFGKQEAEGRGFRPLIGEALSAGIPVLLAVSRTNLDAFCAFADGLEERIAPDATAVTAWAHRAAESAAHPA